MSDTNAANNAPPPAPIRFLGQYVRDLSLEVPHAPGIFGEMRKRAPEIPITFDCAMQHLSGSIFEVTLNVTVNATLGDKPAFILELSYGATVEVDESLIPAEQLHAVLLIEIPRFLFPFVRQILSDMTTNGGFPPLLLQPVDFADLYTRKFGTDPVRVMRSSAQTA
ncbi:MAG: protein-export chaperone SecB [Rhodospirillaceae bacterium]|nr:protein-export chaperone SecB [Rhodospirillaceae bacterium]